MPVYEYVCAECGGLTVIRPLNLAFEAHRCPGCGQPAARVMLTVPAFAAGAGSGDDAPAVVIAVGNNVKAFPRRRPWIVGQ